MTADVSQDRRVTVLNRGHKPPALTEGSRLCWALPSPVHERSGYRASRPTGYKVMRSFRIVIHGPVLASRLACHRHRARCRRAIIAPSSSRSRPLTRRLRRWPSASLDRVSLRRKRAPPTNDALLTTCSPYKVQPDHPAFPAQWLTAYTRSPREPGFLAPVARSVRHASGLGLSVGRPGPHDFAVRIGAVRPPNVTSHASPMRPSHPAANARDDRETPLMRWRDG